METEKALEIYKENIIKTGWLAAGIIFFLLLSVLMFYLFDMFDRWEKEHDTLTPGWWGHTSMKNICRTLAFGFSTVFGSVMVAVIMHKVLPGKIKDAIDAVKNGEYY